MSDERILTQGEVAKIFRKKHKTITNWVGGSNPGFPKGFKYSDARNAERYWYESEIDQFIESRRSCA